MRKILSLAAVAVLLLCGVSAPASAQTGASQAADPPKNGTLREMLGDFLARKGRQDSAAENCRVAYNPDATLARGLAADEYVARRLKTAAERQKKN